MNKIWKYFGNTYKVYLEDAPLKTRIANWDETTLHGHYQYPHQKDGWDIIFPSKLYNKIAGLVGLPKREKNINRMRAGIKHRDNLMGVSATG